MRAPAYDRIGIGYAAIRRPEPRFAERIEAALGDAESVLNVGAGTGSYEPAGRAVTAVEPSRTMIEQRPPGSAPVVQGVAEDLPFADDSFDAAMAIITVHHWSDVRAGLTEMARVARRRLVVLSFDPAPAESLWIFRDYLPRAFDHHVEAMPPIEALTALLPGAAVETVPCPGDCADGFFIALWDRPELHLDPNVRRASSSLHRMAPSELDRGVAKLRADLESGRWDERNGHLRDLPELDIGLRLLTVELHRNHMGLLGDQHRRPGMPGSELDQPAQGELVHLAAVQGEAGSEALGPIRGACCPTGCPSAGSTG